MIIFIVDSTKLSMKKWDSGKII